MKNFIKSQLARVVIKDCLEYLKNPKHRKDFEEWYLKIYGHKYEWKHQQYYKGSGYSVAFVSLFFAYYDIHNKTFNCLFSYLFYFCNIYQINFNMGFFIVVLHG